MNGAEFKSWPHADLAVEIARRMPNQVVGFWLHGDHWHYRTMLTHSAIPPPAANDPRFAP